MAIVHKNHLQAQRCNTSLTQGDFARLLKKYDSSWVCRYEKGKAPPSDEILISYLTICNSSIKKPHSILFRTTIRQVINNLPNLISHIAQKKEAVGKATELSI